MYGMMSIEEIRAELRHELRCTDARAYARELRRKGIGHGVILQKVREVWGEEVADHVEACKGGYYYLPEEESP